MATGKSTVGPRLAARLGGGLRGHRRGDRARERAPRARPLARGGRGRVPASRARPRERPLRRRDPRVIAFGGGTVTVRRARHLPQSGRRSSRSRRRRRRSRRGSARRSRTARTSRSEATRSNARGAPCGALDAYAECHAHLSTDATEPGRHRGLRRRCREPRADPRAPRVALLWKSTSSQGAPATLTDALRALRSCPSLVVVTDAHVQRESARQPRRGARASRDPEDEP